MLILAGSQWSSFRNHPSHLISCIASGIRTLTKYEYHNIPRCSIVHNGADPEGTIEAIGSDFFEQTFPGEENLTKIVEGV
jgi:hypothetical protein